MANPILLKSTLIFGTIQLISMIALECRNIALNTSIAFGIVTSIINHGTTSNIAKWSDRTMMLVGIFIDIHVIESMYLPSYFLTDHMFHEDKPYYYINYIFYPYICYYFLSLSIMSFIMSKMFERILILNSSKKQKTNMNSQLTLNINHNSESNDVQLYKKYRLDIILSCHITSHLLLTITHILMFMFVYV